MSQGNENLEPRWYVVHTYSGYENKVKTDLEKTIKNRELEEFFFNIVVPMEEQVEIKEEQAKMKSDIEILKKYRMIDSCNLAKILNMQTQMMKMLENKKCTEGKII